MRVWGEPVEFKGIRIYPISLHNCMSFYDSVQCLMYQKNRMKEIEIIKMNYLTFLFALIQQDNILFSKLDKVMSLTLKDQIYEFTYEDNHIGMTINDTKFTGYDFEEIQKIILDQNLIQHKEDFYDDAMEKDLQEAEEFLASKNGTPATLEERIIALHCLSGISYLEIKNYTIFQFNKTLERFSIIKNFDIYSALMAENGESKNIQHWLSHVDEKEKYADAIMSESDFNKITADKDTFNKA